MWLWTRQEAQSIDQKTIQSGISATVLMEKAGQRSAQKILQLYPHIRSAVVLCGPGHNGKDGQIVARELKKHFQLMKESTATVQVFNFPQDSDLFLTSHHQPDLWVDAIFGLGLNRNIEEPYLKVLQKLIQQPGLKVSLDLPSGLDANTGLPLPVSVKADCTLTVGHAKPGFYLNQGPEHVGKIHCIDIDFPKDISLSEARSTYLLSRKLMQRWLPTRLATDHKAKAGSCLIWAGSEFMPGAAILAARAASRMGAGYVFVTRPEVLNTHPEAILWNQSGFEKIRAVLLGPGLGLQADVPSYLQTLRQTNLPAVIDADAITLAAKMNLKPFKSNWIITPHAGELARLLNVNAADIEADRLKYARLAQKTWGGTIVLKGFHTVVATSEVLVIIPTGNAALAKGGSGDVLSGMMVALLGQGLTPERAAMVACYVHGWMADQWLLQKKDVISLTPSDLIEGLPKALHQIRA